MLSAIIIDDEPQNAESLRKDLMLYCPSVVLMEICLSAKYGIQSIKKHNPDFIFLDIEMPWMNGFEMLEVFNEINFGVIFTTAYDQYAAKAFRISAIDYLLKPIDPAELKVAVQKVQQNKMQPNQANINNLLQNIKQPAINQKIAIPNKDGYEFIDVQQILYCEAEGAYSKLTLLEKRNLLVSKTLGDIEELLPEELFFRIHHSTIVNLKYVTHFLRRDGGYVKMQSGEQLSISKSRREAVIKKLGFK